MRIPPHASAITGLQFARVGDFSTFREHTEVDRLSDSAFAWTGQSGVHPDRTRASSHARKVDS